MITKYTTLILESNFPSQKVAKITVIIAWLHYWQMNIWLCSILNFFSSEDNVVMREGEGVQIISLVPRPRMRLSKGFKLVCKLFLSFKFAAIFSNHWQLQYNTYLLDSGFFMTSEAQMIRSDLSLHLFGISCFKDETGTPNICQWQLLTRIYIHSSCWLLSATDSIDHAIRCSLVFVSDYFSLEVLPPGSRSHAWIQYRTLM